MPLDVFCRHLNISRSAGAIRLILAKHALFGILHNFTKFMDTHLLVRDIYYVDLT
jgi:hypothetical protein